MDAPLHSVDADAELAALRRRAYGPDADIQRDPEAVARLAELESGFRDTGPSLARQHGRDDAPPAPSLDAVATPPIDVADDGHRPAREAGGAALRPGPSPSRPSRSGRGRVLLLFAVALVAGAVGAATAASIAAVTAPRPDAVLSPDDVSATDDPVFAGSWVGSFRIDRQGLQAWEEYRGYRAWSGTAADGLVCLFVTTEDVGPLQWDCVPPGLQPVADVQAGNGTISLGGGPRMVVRFELRGDEMWVYDRPAQTDESS